VRTAMRSDLVACPGAPERKPTRSQAGPRVPRTDASASVEDQVVALTHRARREMPVGLEFREPGPDDPLFSAARELGDQNRRYLGHLTFDAWKEYAEAGHILVAVDSDSPWPIEGYAAYRTSRAEVVLAHLVVRPESRERKVARALVERLSESYPERRGIGARCRTDWPADKMWPRLGFVPLGSHVGRSLKGHLLTYWWRDHGHADLMTWGGPPASALPVVMDANVFIDLHGANPGEHAPRTREILLEILGDRVELLVTPEMFTEMNRIDDPGERDRLRGVISGQYPRLPVHADKAQTVSAALIGAIGRAPQTTQDRSDLNHIAFTAAAGVSTFVTRDDPVLRRLRTAAAAETGVAVVSPEELVAHIDESEAGLAYQPAALLGTGYSVKEAGSGDDALIRVLYDNASGEKLRDFEGRLRRLAGARPSSSRLLVTDPVGAPIALLGTIPTGAVLSVAAARMNPFALQASFALQAATLLRRTAEIAHLCAIRVADPHAHPVLVDALIRDGFRPSDNGAVALTIPALCTLDELPQVVADAASDPTVSAAEARPWLAAAQRLAAEPSAQTALSLERQFRPLCIIDAPVDSWLVPIQPRFSAPLFGYPQELFARPDELGIGVEHVYYRGGRSGEAAPARVLWYVSGPKQGVVMGRSELIEVVDDPWELAYRKFRRLGVYTRGDVMGTADARGRVRALRVINTEVFAQPLQLPHLKRFAEGLGHGLQLQSPSRISADLFTLIMKEVRR